MAHVELPPAARDRLIDRFGVGARAWIDNFPAIVNELCQKWTLEPRTVLAGGTGAIVECAAEADGTRYALKLSPDRRGVEYRRPMFRPAVSAWTSYSSCGTGADRI